MTGGRVQGSEPSLKPSWPRPSVAHLRRRYVTSSGGRDSEERPPLTCTTSDVSAALRIGSEDPGPRTQDEQRRSARLIPFKNCEGPDAPGSEEHQSLEERLEQTL